MGNGTQFAVGYDHAKDAASERMIGPAGLDLTTTYPHCRIVAPADMANLDRSSFDAIARGIERGPVVR